MFTSPTLVGGAGRRTAGGLGDEPQPAGPAPGSRSNPGSDSQPEHDRAVRYRCALLDVRVVRAPDVLFLRDAFVHALDPLFRLLDVDVHKVTLRVDDRHLPSESAVVDLCEQDHPDPGRRPSPRPRTLRPGPLVPRSRGRKGWVGKRHCPGLDWFGEDRHPTPVCSSSPRVVLHPDVPAPPRTRTGSPSDRPTRPVPPPDHTDSRTGPEGPPRARHGTGGTRTPRETGVSGGWGKRYWCLEAGPSTEWVLQGPPLTLGSVVLRPEGSGPQDRLDGGPYRGVTGSVPGRATRPDPPPSRPPVYDSGDYRVPHSIPCLSRVEDRRVTGRRPVDSETLRDTSPTAVTDVGRLPVPDPTRHTGPGQEPLHRITL